MSKLVITLMPELYGVCRLARDAACENLLKADDGFFSITRTADETSVVCRETLLPTSGLQEKNFRLFKIEGPLDFNLTGILASLLNPLAAAGIAVFTISTYDTDYLLVKAEKCKEAISVLSAVAEIQRSEPED